jgi:hypothetical protein
MPGGGTIPVAVDETSFDALVKSSVKGDSYGVAELVAAGKVFGVDGPVRVLLLDSTFTKCKVRILEGPQTGRAGWVPTEWVK